MNRKTWALIGVLGLIFLGRTSISKTCTFSPRDWSHSDFGGDLSKYEQIENWSHKDRKLAKGKHGMVANFLGARATRAALEALNCGGSAVDAVLTGALTEISITAGRYISFAGIGSLLYYEAKSKKIYFMDATYNRPIKEKDPLSIPTAGYDAAKVSSGRTVLVPGFMRGVESAHRQFGKLKFHELFVPAIYFAKSGIVVDQKFHDQLRSQKRKILRLQGGRNLFLKGSGTLYERGNRFKQIELARTLSRVAKDGNTDHLYKGQWAKDFVDKVRESGGKIELPDLDQYKAIWTEPLKTQYGDFKIVSAGTPGYGGAQLLEAMNVLSAAQKKYPKLLSSEKSADYINSAIRLYYLIQLTRVNSFLTMSSKTEILAVGKQLGIDLSQIKTNFEERSTDSDHASILWGVIEKLVELPATRPGSHSSAVTAIDKEGNIAVFIHTINTEYWGGNGLFVGGISIPDSATFQQDFLARTTPGGRLPSPLNPTIVLKNGLPYLASAAIGSGLHSVTVQSLVNILNYGFNPKESVDRPMFHGTVPGTLAEGLKPNQFSSLVLTQLKKLGMKVKVDHSVAPGFWLGIRILPFGMMEGAVTRLNGIPSYAEGF